MIGGIGAHERFLIAPPPAEHPLTAALRAGMDEDRAEIVSMLRRALDESLGTLFALPLTQSKDVA